MAAVCFSAFSGGNSLSTSWTTMEYPSSYVDTDSFNGAADGTLVIPATGYYWISGDVRRETAEIGCTARLLRNGSELRHGYAVADRVGEADRLTANVTWVGCFVAGDVVELQGQLDSGTQTDAWAAITIFRVPTPFLFATTETDTSDDDPIVWTEFSDIPGWHDDGTNPSRLTVTEDGNYFVSCSCKTGGRYILTASVNGTPLTGHRAVTAELYSNVPYVDVLPLTAGDYVEIIVTEGSVTTDVEQLLVFKIPDATKLVASTDSDGQSVSTIAVLNLDTDEIDTDGFHDTSTNNDRFTVPSGCDGIYFIWASFYLHAFVTVSGWIDRNATSSFPAANQMRSLSASGSVPLAWADDAAAGDYYQVAAANNTTAATADGIRMGMMRLDDFTYTTQTCPFGAPPARQQIYRRI